MKKIILAVVLALSVAGCQNGPSLSQLFQAVTVGTNNPITADTLYEFENGMTIAFAGLTAYRRACISGAVPQSCRQIIANLQVYTRKIPPALITVRTFVKANDQVNAQLAYNTLITLYNQFKTTATANGVQVQ